MKWFSVSSGYNDVLFTINIANVLCSAVCKHITGQTASSTHAFLMSFVNTAPPPTKPLNPAGLFIEVDVPGQINCTSRERWKSLMC